MADVIAEIPIVAKKATRKPLKQKNSSPNEANILAGALSQPSRTVILPSPAESAGKENLGSLSQPRSGKRTKAKKQANQNQCFEKELQDMQEKMQKLRLEKEETEEKLKDKEEMLKMKEEELETRGREQEKLQMELKKLQKMKEFKPTMTLPLEKAQEKKQKKKGCPQMKRPSTPYIRWCKDQWNAIKKANPSAEFKDISNILGAKWKTITTEEKKPYEEKYQAEKVAYLKIVGSSKRENEAMRLLEEEQKQRTAMELLEQYLLFKQEAEKENKKKTKKEKDPLKPKKPMSAFFLFASERRAAFLAENKNVVEVAKITGEEWKSMTEKQRIPYEEMAKQNKEKYVKEMEAYKQKQEEEAANLKQEEEELMKIHKQEALQLLKKKEKTENKIKKTKENRQKKKKQKDGKIDDPNKPRRPASSFLLFRKQVRKELMEERTEINNSTLNALISVKWKELGEQEKQIWNGKAAEAMEAYKKELTYYNKSAAAKENNSQQ